MSKKFKGKTCVYCSTATSVAGDHVFSRKLFLVSRRSYLPQVPACELCNGKKSELEHYVTAVLPFGGRHIDAVENLKSMVPKRLAKNAPLRVSLRKSMKRGWVRDEGLIVPAMLVDLDWQKVEQWLGFVVKGLAWHHWKTLITPDCNIDILALTRHGEIFFQRLLAMRAANYEFEEFGAGSFSYRAAQGVDHPQISVWEFLLYGGLKMGGDPIAPGQTVSKIGVMVGPQPIFGRAEKRGMWLRGEPNGA